MAETPDISIITPTYNRRESLQRAIRSVQQQTYDNYEHIIIDDCSTDDTEELVRSLDDPHIRYIRFREWQGANPARNCGIETARAAHLTFLDSDDEYLPERLQTTLRQFQTTPEVQLLLSSFHTVKRGRLASAINAGVYVSGPDLEHALMASAIYIAGSSITVKRQTIVRAGQFAPTLQRMQDREMLLRLSQHCGALLLDSVDWIKHNSADSISGPRSGYIEAVAALVKAHPDLATRYRKLPCYSIARHLLAELLHGHPRQAIASWQENRKANVLRYSIWQLLRGYLAGRSERRNLVARLRGGASVPTANARNCGPAIFSTAVFVPNGAHRVADQRHAPCIHS